MDEAIQILKGLRPKYEAHHKAKLTDEALETAVRFSDRYHRTFSLIKPSMSGEGRAGAH